VIGIPGGEFQDALGTSTKIQTQVFSSGPTEMTALLAGKLDLAFVGPDPAVNAYIASNGTGLEIIAGATSAGAEFVVTASSGIASVKDLGGKTFAAPGLGNTQDVALRHYLQANGYSTTTNGGNVTVDDTSNSNIVTLFATGKIDGAWVPQPWAAILLADGGKLFLNEQALWPDGQFSTAVLVARTAFLQAHPDVVRDIVQADVQETIGINDNLTAAAAAFNAQYAVLTGAPLNASILTAAIPTLSFTYDPQETTVIQQANYEVSLGFLTAPLPSNIDNIFDLSILNGVLISDGLPTVTN
jgi:NitT/TauT family transport system substrate-binding protein